VLGVALANTRDYEKKAPLAPAALSAV